MLPADTHGLSETLKTLKNLSVWAPEQQAGRRAAKQRRDARSAIGGPGALQRQRGVGWRHAHRVRRQPGPQRAARLGRGRSRRVS